MTKARDPLAGGGMGGAPTRARSLRTVLLLAVLFSAPILLSTLLYYGSGWRPTGRTNHGTLIEPARRLADPLFHGKWSLVYVGSGDCPAECQHALYYMRQTHWGLGQLSDRVQRVFLIDRRCCLVRAQLERSYAGLITREADNAQGTALLSSFPDEGRDHTLFIVDPLGNLMMRYDLGAPPKGLLEDLEHLLRLSSIG